MVERKTGKNSSGSAWRGVCTQRGSCGLMLPVFPFPFLSWIAAGNWWWQCPAVVRRVGWIGGGRCLNQGKEPFCVAVMWLLQATKARGWKRWSVKRLGVIWLQACCIERLRSCAVWKEDISIHGNACGVPGLGVGSNSLRNDVFAVRRYWTLQTQQIHAEEGLGESFAQALVLIFSCVSWSLWLLISSALNVLWIIILKWLILLPFKKKNCVLSGALLVCLLRVIYLKGRTAERAGERHSQASDLPVHSPNGCNGQSWARQKTGDWNSS